MQTQSSHNWKFFKSARCVQAKIETGADVAELGSLDRKLWTVLSASVDGLRFDAATLKLLDTNGDGRIRADEVLAAIDWMKARFKSLDFLFARKAEIAMADLDDGSDAGKALTEAFKRILKRADKASAPVVTLEDVAGTASLFNVQPFNGDGVVTAKSTADAEVAAAIADIGAAEGTLPDRSGENGVDKAKVEAFFADAAAYLGWKSSEAAASALGGATAAAWDAYSAVCAKIDEYFTPPEDLPLIAEDPTPMLPLADGVNPLWRARFAAFAEKVASPALGREGVESITRDEWSAIKAKLAPYGDWLSGKAGTAVESLGVERLTGMTKDGRIRAAIDDLLAKDLAFADELSSLVDCERAVRYAAHLADWLGNFVNQSKLYNPKDDSVFRIGTLYIDGRACHLCFHVANEGAHAALAEKSRCCLLYVKLTRKSTGEAKEVCAVITAGVTSSLYVGRNGVFYDCDGGEWDAVVAKVVEAQVSLREAFWAPWAKIAGAIGDQCKKFLGSSQDAAVAKVGAGATAAATAAPAAKPDGAALASSVAALGVGVGMAGAACAGLIGLVAGLPLWKVLAGVAAVILLVSLPSVVLAWFKLRARDLGAILNAGGWAVNRPLYFSMGLARTFTSPARMPMGSVTARDPYASGGWIKVLVVVLLLAAAAFGVCWKMGWLPCCRSCKAPAAPAAEAAPAAPAAEAAK